MRSCRSCDMSREYIKEILSTTFAQKLLFKRSVQEQAIWDQCPSDLCPKIMSIRIYPRDCPRNMSKNYVHNKLSTGLSAKYVQKIMSIRNYPRDCPRNMSKIVVRDISPNNYNPRHAPGFYCPKDLSGNNFPGIISIIFFIKTMPGYFFL